MEKAKEKKHCERRTSITSIIRLEIVSEVKFSYTHIHVLKENSAVVFLPEDDIQLPASTT